MTQLAELPNVPCRVVISARSAVRPRPRGDDSTVSPGSSRIFCSSVHFIIEAVVEIGGARRWPTISQEGTEDGYGGRDDRYGALSAPENDQLCGRIGEVGV